MKHSYRRLACAGAATVGVAVTALVLAGPTASAEQCAGSVKTQDIVARAIGADCVLSTGVLSAGKAALANGGSGQVLVATPNVASPPAEPETGNSAPQIPEETPSSGPQVPETTPPEPTPPEVTPPGETMSPGPEVPSSTPPGETASPAPQVPGSGPRTPGNGSPAPQLPAAAAPQPQLPVTGGHGAEAAALGGTALGVGAIMVLAATRRRRPDNGR